MSSIRVPYVHLLSKAARRLVPTRFLCQSAVATLTILGAPCLGGCSMSFPIGSLVPADEPTTGSLAKVPFGQLLEEEDRRREKAALSTALDPQGDGSTIHWENPKTGNTGAITPVGQAYPADSKICRAFVSDLHHDGGARSVQGTACTVAAGEWAVKDVKPFSKV